jgi:hypothetical protein
MEIDLETILIELDPASLMSFDEKTQRYENEDEYDIEAELIYPHLRDCENISEFHRKLADVFDKMFEKLYYILIRNENKNIPMVSLYMENLLNILESEKLAKKKEETISENY